MASASLQQGLCGGANASLNSSHSLQQQRQAGRSLSMSRSSLYSGSERLASVVDSSATAASPAHAQHARLVVEARKRRGMPPGYGRPQQQSMPKIDTEDDTPKFVIFIKTKNVNLWYPLSVVSGGTVAKLMTNAMKWDLGKKLYSGTLTRNIGQVIYKDEKAIQTTAIKQYPMLKGASGFEYGYKIVDPANPKGAMTGSNVTRVPPEEELRTVVDKAKSFVDNSLASIKESFGGLSKNQQS